MSLNTGTSKIVAPLLYHPSEKAFRDWKEAHEQLEDLYSDSERLMLLEQKFGEKAVELTEYLHRTTLSSHGHRSTLETMMVNILSQSNDVDLEQYYNLTQSHHNVGQLVEWFDDASHSSVSEIMARTDSYDHSFNLEASKGVAISLGSEVQAGLYPIDHGSPLNRIVRNLPHQLNALKKDYQLEMLEHKKSKPRYNIYPVLDENGDLSNYLRFIRDRAVADVNTPEGRRLQIAKRAIGLVAVDALDNKMYKRIEVWQNDMSSDAKRAEVIRSIGSLHFLARQGDPRGIAALPESTDYILRSPHKVNK